MTIPAISPVQFGRYRFFSYIRINEYLKSIIWKYITLKPVSLTGCWDVSKVYRHAWTGCMRKMRIKGLVSDWTVRMSACALTFLPVPCRPFVIPDGWRSPRFSVNFITNRKMWRVAVAVKAGLNEKKAIEILKSTLLRIW